MHLHVLAYSAKCHEVIRFSRGLVRVIFVVPQALTTGFAQSLKVFASLGWWWCRDSCPEISVNILGTNCDQCWSTVQCCFTSTETVRLVRTESPGRPPRLSHSSWTLKWKFVENGISFSRPWKSVKTEWGLWKFVVLRALGKNSQCVSQKLHFPRPNSSLKNKQTWPCKITKNALPVSFDE